MSEEVSDEDVKLILERVNKLEADNYRYSNALEWIRYLALIHYSGQAFEPEHMRVLCNLAADALSESGPFLPDWLEANQEAIERGRKRYDEIKWLFG